MSASVGRCPSVVDDPGPARRERARSLLLALSAALMLAALGASSAQAAGAGTGTTEITCQHVVFSYEGFANAPGNTVTQVVTIAHNVISKTTFSFDGPSGSDTVPITAVAGKYLIDAHAVWRTNGVKGGFDHHVQVRCAADFSIEKQQRIRGSEAGFTTLPLAGSIGQTVEYEIVVTNTGVVPVTFSSFTDPHCDEGTIAGGSGESPLAPGASSTYTCDHVLSAGGSYTNQATATAAAVGGSPITHSSNAVVVNVPAEPGFSIEKLQEIAGSEAGLTTAPLASEVGRTIDYEMLVTNTGNVPLRIESLTDAHCASIAGGPGESLLAPGASSTYTCSHVLVNRDGKTGFYENTASALATPPPGDGPSVASTSNTVTVTIPGGIGITEISCTQVTFVYTGFPEAEGNTVHQVLTVAGQVVSTTIFTFNGSSGTDTVPIEGPPGKYLIDAHAFWNTNNAKGGFDHHVKVKCTG